MNTLAALIFAVLGTVVLALPTLLRVYRRLRGPRVVTCPATLESEVVEFAAARAAATAPFGTPKLRVRTCSRWPEHRNCDQDCLEHVDPTAAEAHGLLTRPLRLE